MANEKRLIDVNRVIDSMQKCLDESPDKKDSVAYVTFEALITCLKQEPTMDAVEVVHGRWESVDYDIAYECSVCRHPTQYNLSNYCPNCGAKMDGERKTE